MSVPPQQPHRPPMDFTRTTTSPAAVAGVLAGLVSHAALCLPEAAGCSVMARQQGGSATLAHDGPLALALDSLQHKLGSGPSLSAIDDGEEVVVPCLAQERRWSPFPQQAAEKAGARFTVALPLLTDRKAQGALTLYGTHPCELEPLRARARPLAVRLGAVLRMAQDAEEASATIQGLCRALTARATIDQAIGILMAQQRCSAADAFEILRRTSQNRNIKLRTLSQSIVAGITAPAGTPVKPDPG